MIHCFVSVLGPYALLSYFLKYYSRVGVDHFIFNSYEADPDRYRRIKRVFADCGVSYEVGFWERGKKDYPEAERFQRIADMVAGGGNRFLDDWTLYPDLDEFAEFPGGSIRAYTNTLPESVQIIHGQWWDRVTKDGELVKIDPARPLEDQFPVMARIARLFLPDPVTRVIVACKGLMLPAHHTNSAHRLSKKMFSDLIPVHHFKWNSVVRDRLQERSIRYTKLQTKNAKSLGRTARYLQKHEKLPVNDPRVQGRLSKNRLEI